MSSKKIGKIGKAKEGKKSNVIEMPKRSEVRRVMIGTPSHDGKLDVWYVNSLLSTLSLCSQNRIAVFPIFLSYDALIQRARNDLFAIAFETKVDDLIFIDSDMEWNPQDFLKILRHPVDVVAGTARKKTDDSEVYALHLKEGEGSFERDPSNGLVEVEGIGCAFTRFSRKAVRSLWDSSELYASDGKPARNIFEVKVINGELFSEDIVVCRKWAVLGGTVWFDPTITCNHIGVKKYIGNFQEWEKRVNGGGR